MSEPELFSPLARVARRIARRRRDSGVPAIEPPRQPGAINPLPAAPARWGSWHGEKFPGGLGPLNLLQIDYWTLRARSAEAFHTNLYARGLIRRLVTNIISTGLHIEATPQERLLGFAEEELAEWSETIEARFEIWANTPRLCDFRGMQTFGQLQASMFRESFVTGDVLVVLHQDPISKLPQIELVNGQFVQTPIDRILSGMDGRKIVEGVEIDQDGRHLAYYVRQRDILGSKRIPSFDQQGRRLAWMVYGSDKRHDAVRGEPILSLVLQSLREIDRYRDAAVRKAVINSITAMFIKRDPAVVGQRSFGAAGITRGTATAVDQTNVERTFNTADYIPGLVLDQLAPGETPHGFIPNGTDEKFGAFEEAIIQAVAWAHEIPPEILRLAFSHNYSASQAANNEFNLFLHLARHNVASAVCQPVYEDWLISEALMQRFDRSQLVLDAWRNPLAYDAWGAWLTTDWSGQIKPAADILKVTNAHKLAVDEGFELRSRAARELTGGKYRRYIRQAKRENELLAEALEPLKALDRKQEPGSVDQMTDEEYKDEDDERAAS